MGSTCFTEQSVKKLEKKSKYQSFSDFRIIKLKP